MDKFALSILTRRLVFPFVYGNWSKLMDDFEMKTASITPEYRPVCCTVYERPY